MSTTGDLFKKGDVIGGKYLVHGTLGKGGFGVVYLVSDRETRHVRALKSFRDEFLADSHARETFQKEALVWVRLGDHPFVLAARWVETFSGRLYVAMDYVEPDTDGRVTLNDHVRSGRPFSLERVVELSIQFCLGMEHANTHGVICHRDIKPANILISRGVLKISDFGLAVAAEQVWKCVAGNGKPLITGSAKDGFGFSIAGFKGRMRCGTPGYMPPEVYRGEPADVRSDIYGFGLVLWQMAAGSASPPFVGVYRGDSEAYMRDAYERQMSGRFPPTTPPLASIIERCLNPTPAKRFPSFREVRHELEPIFYRLAGRHFSLPVSEQTAAVWSDRGGSLGALGRFEEAITCFDKALEIDPQDAMAWSNKGAMFVELQRCEDAILCFDKAIASDPHHALAWHNRAGALVELGRRLEAMDCYDKALAIDPRYVEAWNNKGRNLAFYEQHEEAISCFDKALSIDPRHAAAWLNKGGSLRALGRHKEVLVCFDNAIAIDPKDAMAWNNKGAFLASLGRREEAIDCYERALAIDPQHVMAWFNKANALTAKESYQDALVCFQEAQKLGLPNAAKYVEECRRLMRTREHHLGTSAATTNGAQEYFSKAADLAKIGKHAEAVSCYETGLRLDPTNAAAWFNMGHSIGFLGRHQDVVKCCDRALEINPNFPPLWILKGLGLLSMEHFRDAMDCFQQAEKMGEASAAGHMARCRMAHAEWYFRLGSQYQQEGNNAEAINCYEKGLALNPVGNAIIWSNKGAALLALKRGQEAVVCFDRAISLDPRDASAWNNKGCALLAIGRQSEGYACIQEAKRLRQ